MRMRRKRWRQRFSRRYYILTKLELWLWKLWADLTQLVKHRRLPRKRTTNELREASRLLRTWLKRDREEHHTPNS